MTTTMIFVLPCIACCLLAVGKEVWPFRHKRSVRITDFNLDDDRSWLRYQLCVICLPFNIIFFIITVLLTSNNYLADGFDKAKYYGINAIAMLIYLIALHHPHRWTTAAAFRLFWITMLGHAVLAVCIDTYHLVHALPELQVTHTLGAGFVYLTSLVINVLTAGQCWICQELFKNEPQPATLLNLDGHELLLPEGNHAPQYGCIRVLPVMPRYGQGSEFEVGFFRMIGFGYLTEYVKRKGVPISEMPPVGRDVDMSNRYKRFQDVWDAEKCRNKPSLCRALFKVLWVRWVCAGMFEGATSLGIACSPMVLKLILNAVAAVKDEPNLAVNYQLQALGCVLLLALANTVTEICTRQYLFRNFTLGAQARGLLMCAVGDKVVKITLDSVQNNRDPDDYAHQQRDSDDSAIIPIDAEATSQMVSEPTSLTEHSMVDVQASLAQSNDKSAKTVADESASSGRVVNLVTIDACTVDFALTGFHNIWSAVLQLSIDVCLLYQQIGPPAFAALGVMAIVVPLARALYHWNNRIQERIMKSKDSRIRVTGEVLSHLKTVKMYAWEYRMAERITRLRNIELRQLWTNQIADIISSIFWNGVPLLLALTVFALCAVFQDRHPVDTQTIWTASALIGYMAFPLSFLPMVFTSLSEGLVAVRRLEKFFLLPEIPGRLESPVPDDAERDTVVRAISAIVKQCRPDTGQVFSLGPLDFSVARGNLVLLTGAVGSGKSTLLKAVLGELPCELGAIVTRTGLRIAFAAQQPWLQNKTLQDNIVFGERWNPNRYRRVIDACALATDLHILPDGDQTLIGELGVNLSGGQKQRVAIARAIYRDADLYIFDDVFSAVDVHVAQHIFTHVIEDLLRGRAVLMSTHRLEICSEKANQILYLPAGAKGSLRLFPSVEVAMADREFHDFVDHAARNYGDENDGASDDSSSGTEGECDIAPVTNVVSPTPIASDYGGTVFPQDNMTASDSQQQATTVGTDSASATSVSGGLAEPATPQTRDIHLQDTPGRRPAGSRKHDRLESRNDSPYKSGSEASPPRPLINCEELETGDVPVKVYWSYIHAAGGWVIVGLLIMLYVITKTVKYGNTFLLTYWANHWTDAGIRRRGLKLYAIGQAVTLIFLCIENYVLACCSQRTGRYFHTAVLNRIMDSTATFFDTHPSGDMLSRLSRDLATVDQSLPWIMSQFLGQSTEVLGGIVASLSATPILLLLLPVLGCLYFRLQRLYIITARQLARAGAALRAPIITLLSECLDGGAVIRAQDRQDWVFADYLRRIQMALRNSCLKTAVDRWLEMRLLMLGLIFSTAASCLCILYVRHVSVGLSGLVIGCSFSLPPALNWLVKMNSDRETSMVAIERLDHYQNEEYLPIEKTEAPVELPVAWPERGEIVLTNVTLRYGDAPENKITALRGVTVRVKPCEKVGVVGRTGAGKTSLLAALLRLVDVEFGGQIVIDGLPIERIKQHQLRARVSVMPQDATLIVGSIRSNLDPFDQYSDAELWEALRCSCLDEVVRQAGGLDTEVTENGANFSLGQRQLMCLARVLLKKSKILLLDEATSSVDPRTDAIVQQTLRREFNQCTIVTIAHRLRTVLDYDKIAVMDHGRLVEFGPPAELLSNPQGVFSCMVHKMNQGQSEGKVPIEISIAGAAQSDKKKFSV